MFILVYLRVLFDISEFQVLKFFQWLFHVVRKKLLFALIFLICHLTFFFQWWLPWIVRRNGGGNERWLCLTVAVHSLLLVSVFFFYGKRNFREFLQLRRFIAVNSLFVYFYWLKKNIILCGNFCTFVGYKKGKKGGRKLYDEALFTFI